MRKVEFLADRPEAIPIVARWYFDTWGFKDSENSFKATCARLATKLNRASVPIPIVVTDGLAVIGAAQLKRFEMETYPDYEFWLGGVFVRPSERGTGVVEHLITKIVELAQSLNIKQLYLQSQHPTGGVYTKFGWNIIHSLVHKNVPVVVMMKQIDTSIS